MKKNIFNIFLLFGILLCLLPSCVSAASVSGKNSRINLSKCTITLSKSAYIYDGTKKYPKVTVRYGNSVLKKNRDYTCYCTNNLYVGKAYVTISGKGKYYGTIKKYFTIKAPKKSAAKKITGSFPVQSKESSNIFSRKYNAIYSDEYFFKKSTSAYTPLAKLSALASATAYSKSYALNFLRNCGFSNRTYEYSSPDITVPSTSDNDHVAYAFGTRYVPQEDATIIAIVIRGSYKEEWYSNFNIGNGNVHAGFQKASNELYTKLVKKITSLKKSNKIHGNLKIWVTGHSRGAAVANLLSVQLNKRFSEKNVFSYTFATPRCINIKKINPDVAKNIFNYLNSSDFITEVVPYSYDFGRYGTDLTVKFNYSMTTRFKKLTNSNYDGFTTSDKHKLLSSFTQLAGSQSAYSRLQRTPTGKKISPETYCKDVIASALCGNCSSSELIKRIMEYRVYLPNSFAVSCNLLTEGVITSHFRHSHCIEAYLSIFS